MPTAIDLFCGCGGMSLGLTNAGITMLASIDIWNVAIESYKQNFKHLALCRDLTTFNPAMLDAEHFNNDFSAGRRTLDILVGCPPCQGFSNAGKRDINDPRNSLFMRMVEYLNYFKPKVFMIENVIGLLSMKTATGEKTIDIILSLVSADYNCIVCKLYASDFGVMQNRRRVIIIGVRKDAGMRKDAGVRKDIGVLPVCPEATVEIRRGVGDALIPQADVPPKYFLSQRAIDGINSRKLKAKNNGYGFGANMLQLDKPSYTISARYWKDGYDALVKYSETSMRRLTILELKRIQSFPDDYIITGSGREIIMQIGNAVAPLFATALGEHVKQYLD